MTSLHVGFSGPGAHISGTRQAFRALAIMGKPEDPPAYQDSTRNNGNSSQNAPSGSKGADSRPLPDGWVKQFDNKYVFPACSPSYKQHFYVDTRANPPRSTWIHPEDEKNQYSAPSGPPPGQDQRQFGSGSGGGPGQQPYPQQGYYPQQQYYPQQAYQQPYYPQQQYQQPMMQQSYMSSGRFGGLGGGRMGGGMGNMGAGLLGGGVGLLGGMALANGMGMYAALTQNTCKWTPTRTAICRAR